MMPADEPKLLPCPICRAGETAIRENRLAPTMEREGALISAVLTHHCVKQDGITAQIIEVRGGDREAVIAAWNRRATGARPEAPSAELVERAFALDLPLACPCTSETCRCYPIIASFAAAERADAERVAIERAAKIADDFPTGSVNLRAHQLCVGVAIRALAPRPEKENDHG